MNDFRDYALLQKNLVDAINQEPDQIQNVLGLQWINKSAQARANQIVQSLGVPNSVDVKAKGMIVWRYVDPFFRMANVYTDDQIDSGLKPTDVYSKLVIKDEEIPHLVPVPHTDWFYAYMFIDIDDKRVSKVLKLTESVGYDTMSKELYARCHFMPANLTSLYLAKQIALGHKSLSHARQEYVILIPTLAKEEMEGRGINLPNSMIGPWHMALTQYTFGLHA